jgi:hypothetical protein
LALGAFLLAGQSLAGAWTRTEIWYGATAARGFRPTENGLFSSLALDREFNVRVSLVIVGTFLLIALGVLGEMGSRRGRSNERFFWGGAGLLALLSTLPGAGVVWEAVPVLSKLQFPWRVGAVLTLIFSALLVKVERRSLRFVLTFTVLAAALPFLGSSTTLIEGLLSQRTAKAAPSAACTVAPSPEAVATAWGDVSNLWMRNPLLLDVWYVPRSAAPGLVAEVFGDGAPIYPALRRQVAFAPAEPDAPVRVVTCRHPNREVEIELQSASQVVLRAFFFPGFTVRVDRRLVSAEQDPRSGLLSVSLPAGVHRVEWSWAAPPRVFFARGVSGFSLIVLSALVLMAGFRKEEKAAPRS